MDLQIRPVADDAEFRAFLEVDARAFATEVREDDLPYTEGFLERDRTAAAFLDGQLVGSSANLTMELTVPGGVVVPCAGVTYVGVSPTHRRRGLLTAMMGRLLDEAVDRDEPMAALFASESVIYGRFGFGAATQSATYSLAKAHARFSHPATTAGTIRLIDREGAAAVLAPVQDRVRRRVAGATSRSKGWWDRHIYDAPGWRHGGGPLFHAVHDPAGSHDPDAYITWRVETSWEIHGSHVVRVWEVQALDPTVRLALQQFVCSLDLIAEIRFEDHPVDEPLRWTLADPRRLMTTSVIDALWVRLLDIPRCLEARAYQPADRLVIAVDDRFRPAVGGTFALDTGGGRVRCTRTEAAPELSLDVADLGALYLGGVSAAVLAAAGRLRGHADGAVERAAALFATPTAPLTDTNF